MPPPASSPPTASGERRMLTVLFSDLVDWTALTHRLDVEEARDILEHSRRIVIGAIERYGGYVAHVFGDGLMAYFGYPQALERGAQSGVKAALEIVAQFRTTAWPAGIEVAAIPHIRVGLHSGIVFVGAMAGTRGADLDAVVGATPNIASRIQTAAVPDSVFISDATYQLVEGQFECRHLGPQALKGLPQPMTVYEVLGERSHGEQWERVQPGRLRPLHGREGELAVLRERWAEAQSGRTPMLAVAGGAGIGKSRLVAELTGEIRSAGTGVVFEFQCSPYHEQSSYFPVLRALSESVLGLDETQPVAARIARVEQAVAQALPDDGDAPAFAQAFLGLGEPDARVLSLPAESRKTRTMEVVARLFRTQRPEIPRLFLFNDVHWADASTIEWAQWLAGWARGALLLYCTRTPETLAPGTEVVRLRSLDDEAVGELVHSIAGGKVLPSEALALIARTTAGVPLYVEEFTRALLAGGTLREHESYYELAGSGHEQQVPFSLHDLLVSRFDRLGPAKAMAQLAAVIGTEFPAAMAEAMWETEEAGEASRLLEMLVKADILERDPAAEGAPERLRFRHILVRNAAYESLLRSTRARHHRRIAERLLASQEMARDHAAGLVAQHFVAAGMPAESAPYWAQAAAASLQRSACVEAAAHARAGLGAIEAAGVPPALAGLERLLASALGTALLSTEGFGSPEAGAAFDRAERAGGEAAASVEHFPVECGLWAFHISCGHLTRAARHAAAMVAVGRGAGGDRLLIEGLAASGAVAFWQGDLARAMPLLEEAIRIYRPEFHQNALVFGQNPVVVARAYLGLVLAFAGRPAEAAQVTGEALALARAVQHPHSIAWALGAATATRLVAGDIAATLEIGREAMRYCMEHQHPFWLCTATLMTAWARLQTGETAAARRMMEEGFAAYEQLGTRLSQPVFCALLADACLATGDPAMAGEWARRGLAIVDDTGEDLSRPGLLLARAQAALSSTPPGVGAAEADSRAALALAQAQGAGTRAMQAAATLAHVLAAQGRGQEALAVLEPLRPVIEAAAGNPLLAPLRQLLDALSAGEKS